MAVVPVHCSRDVTLVRSNKGEPPMLDLQCDPQFGHGASPCTMRTTVYTTARDEILRSAVQCCCSVLCAAQPCGGKTFLVNLRIFDDLWYTQKLLAHARGHSLACCAVPGLGTSVRAAALHKFNVNHTLKQPLTNTHHIN